jgi:hypothetical protein
MQLSAKNAAVPRMDNLSDVEDRLSPKPYSRMAACGRFSCEFKGFLNGTDYATPTRISLLPTSTRRDEQGREEVTRCA